MRGVGTPCSRNQSASEPYSGRCAKWQTIPPGLSTTRPSSLRRQTWGAAFVSACTAHVSGCAKPLQWKKRQMADADRLVEKHGGLYWRHDCGRLSAVLAALKRRIREFGNKLARIHASPHEIAAGFALGVFVSFCRSFHCGQWWRWRRPGCSAKTSWLRSSVRALASSISPWCVSVGREYRLGRHIMQSRKRRHSIVRISGEVFTWAGRVAATFIGGALIGLPVAVVSYIVGAVGGAEMETRP